MVQLTLKVQVSVKITRKMEENEIDWATIPRQFLSQCP